MRWCIAAAALLLCGVNAFAFTLREASSIYHEKFASAPPSLQESGEYCFLIVEGSLADAPKGNVRPLVLAGEMKLLNRYIGGVGLGYESPFCPAVMGLFTSRIEFEIPTCRCVTVENSQEGDCFRHVSAYEAGPLRVARDRALRHEKGRRSVNAWCRDVGSLARKYENLKSGSFFWARMGASIPFIKAECKLMQCVGVPINGAAAERLVRTWNPDKANKTECVQALSVLPTFSLAHGRMGEIDESEGNHFGALMETLYAGVAGEFDVGKFSRQVSAFSRQTHNPAWNELCSLAKGIAVRKQDLNTTHIPFWDEVSRSVGLLFFDKTEDANAACTFETAKELFLKGEDLPSVISLLEQSLTNDPGCGDAWRYYAAALRTAGRIEDAVVAGHEAVVLGDNDYVAAWEVIRCYRLMGLDGLAAANAWWISVSAEDIKLKEKATSLLRKISPNVFE